MCAYTYLAEWVHPGDPEQHVYRHPATKKGQLGLLHAVVVANNREVRHEPTSTMSSQPYPASSPTPRCGPHSQSLIPRSLRTCFIPLGTPRLKHILSPNCVTHRRLFSPWIYVHLKMHQVHSLMATPKRLNKSSNGSKLMVWGILCLARK